MCRIAGIFKEDGKDSFTQTSYGKKKPSIQYLVEVNNGNVDIINEVLYKDDTEKYIKESNYMYGVWIPEKTTYTNTDDEVIDLVNVNKYLHIKY
jgi:hypothetical protein